MKKSDIKEHVLTTTVENYRAKITHFKLGTLFLLCSKGHKLILIA